MQWHFKSRCFFLRSRSLSPVSFPFFICCAPRFECKNIKFYDQTNYSCRTSEKLCLRSFGTVKGTEHWPLAFMNMCMCLCVCVYLPSPFPAKVSPASCECESISIICSRRGRSRCSLLVAYEAMLRK